MAAERTHRLDLTDDERDVVVNALTDYRELVRDQADDYEHQHRTAEAAACTADAATATDLLDRLEV